MSSDLANALAGVLVLVVPVVGGMIVVALRKLAAKWGLEGTAQNTANMESDIKAALNVGITKVLPVIEAKGWNAPDVHAAILGAATEYLTQHFPDRSAQIAAAAQPRDTEIVAFTGAHPVPASAAIAQTLAARLPDAIATAAASPATPPAGPAAQAPASSARAVPVMVESGTTIVR